jgi:hypothetical protein
VLLLCSTLSSAHAYAQGSTDELREAEAKAYFLSGVELLKTGKLEAALEQFSRSREIVPRAKNTINAAICLERLGRLDEAAELYEEVQGRHGGELPTPELERLVTVLKSLDAKVGRVVVRSNVREGSVQVDGKPRGKVGAPLRLMPESTGSASCRRGTRRSRRPSRSARGRRRRSRLRSSSSLAWGFCAWRTPRAKAPMCSSIRCWWVRSRGKGWSRRAVTWWRSVEGTAGRGPGR